jgi:hypothetical protein
MNGFQDVFDALGIAYLVRAALTRDMLGACSGGLNILFDASDG